jgi:hypothetical protein
VALTRPYRIGLVAVVGIVAGAAALSSLGFDGTSAPGHSTAPSATDAAPRATPSVAPEPIAVDIKVQKQLAYVLAHWKKYNLAQYGQVGHNDCVDFASQSLITRGWAMDSDWHSAGSGSTFTFSKAWVSSTSMMHYMADSGRATALTDAQRDKVKLGDIVQFDWDKSGDRDHTGIVTRIEGSGDKIKIYYAGHTDDTDYRSVDWAITVNHPGGRAYYWSIP